jgi:hypothetical protein
MEREVHIMARPRKSDDVKKGRKVSVRFSDAEYKKIFADAKVIGVGASELIRAKCLTGVVKIPRIAKANNQLIGALSKFGGQLKQMHIESGGAYSERTAAMLGEIHALLWAERQRITDDREAHTESEAS